MPLKIVRTSDMPWAQMIDKGRFNSRRKDLGGQRLGCGLWELPAGKRSFPLHFHHGTEEAMFAISGSAKVRTPEGETPLNAGDFVSFPPGGPAHQLINDGTQPFVYFAISHSVGADVVEYPDSGKIACAAGTFPNLKRYVFNGKDQTDYWAGEE